MKISSFNVTDVAYLYIGLRVISALPAFPRKEQDVAVSRNVLKYARDRAVRLLLPEPRGTFETVGPKVCQELVHLGLARPAEGLSVGLELTEPGKGCFELLQSQEHRALRREIVQRHLETYDNLRGVVRWHLDNPKGFLMPILDTSRWEDTDYLVGLLLPTLGETASKDLVAALRSAPPQPGGREDFLHGVLLEATFGGTRRQVAVYRAMFDRLSSLRILNMVRVREEDATFLKSYTTCLKLGHPDSWTTPIEVQRCAEPFILDYRDPKMDSPDAQHLLAAALRRAFEALEPQAGYYDLPDVRDFVCERLLIPEAAFDEGINVLLDATPRVITVGLTYDRISGRRRPLVRHGESAGVYNLLRSA